MGMAQKGRRASGGPLCPWRREAAPQAKAVRELSHTGWYWGSMTANEAKEKLKEAPEGTFLIRDSSHSDYLLTMLKHQLDQLILHRIPRQEIQTGLSSYVSSPSLNNLSVVHLIDYYVRMCKDKRTGPEVPPGIALFTFI